MAKASEYKTFVSPDGKHTQKVGSRLREAELRFAGWREDTGKTGSKTTTAGSSKADTPKETTK